VYKDLINSEAVCPDKKKAIQLQYYLKDKFEIKVLFA